MIGVTGATGLLGGHLLLELVRQNQPVKAFIRKNTNPNKVLSIWKHYEKQPDELLNKVEWVKIDLTEKYDLFESLQEVSQLYHCAGKVSFDPRDKKELNEINIRATRNLVNTCLEIGNIRFLYVSSIAALGKSENDVISEDNGWPGESVSLYARSKMLGELEVWRGITEGLNGLIVNPSVILGPGNWGNSSARIFDIVYKGLNFYTLGETGFVDVLDVVRIMMVLMKTDISNERFILNAENISYKALFDKVAGALQTKPPENYVNPLVTSLFWRFEAMKQFFTGIDPRLTRQSAKTSHLKKHYSAEKINKITGILFRPLDETIERIAGNYLNEKQPKIRN